MLKLVVINCALCSSRWSVSDFPSVFPTTPHETLSFGVLSTLPSGAVNTGAKGEGLRSAAAVKFPRPQGKVQCRDNTYSQSSTAVLQRTIQSLRTAVYSSLIQARLQAFIFTISASTHFLAGVWHLRAPLTPLLETLPSLGFQDKDITLSVSPSFFSPFLSIFFASLCLIDDS